MAAWRSNPPRRDVRTLLAWFGAQPAEGFAIMVRLARFEVDDPEAGERSPDW
ncbi:hypothetical protein [Frankia sp. Cr2]|uniref:hypothetical protein n=1 Tax=Frankia sp. Cr2 TaxID=3073932 RepID=UPI002AD214A4|nr:hypothetical protein [Frankia sp. Cr2]